VTSIALDKGFATVAAGTEADTDAGTAVAVAVGAGFGAAFSGSTANPIRQPSTSTTATIMPRTAHDKMLESRPRLRSLKIGLSSRSLKDWRRAVSIGPGNVKQASESLLQIVRGGIAGRNGRPANGE
jgi:hypothetical protein